MTKITPQQVEIWKQLFEEGWTYTDIGYKAVEDPRLIWYHLNKDRAKEKD